MPNYENGVIYKIFCKNPEIKDIYIGSTTIFQYRKYRHKSHCKNTNYDNSFKYKFINENGGWENWEMIELEKYEAEDKLSLEEREKYYINLLKPTLNSVKIYPSKEELNIKAREYNKKYYDNNKEKVKQMRKKYIQNNKEKIKQLWEKSYEKRREKIKCECGAVISKNSLSRHKKSKKHLKYFL